MKTILLTQDHQGVPANTTLTGPTLIPGTTDKYGYFPEGQTAESRFCFYESYILSNPTIFKDITQTT